MGDIFKSLSSATRRAIMTYLFIQPRHVNELAKLLNITAPTASSHLEVLQNAGLIESTRKGKFTHYRIAAGKPAARIYEFISNFCPVSKQIYKEQLAGKKIKGKQDAD